MIKFTACFQLIAGIIFVHIDIKNFYKVKQRYILILKDLE